MQSQDHRLRRRPPIGTLLKQWRAQRKLSQTALALGAGVSPRHLGFIEVGRSAPSREMVLRLGSALELPLRECNFLLQVAGFAPEFGPTDFTAPEMEHVRAAIEFIIEKQQPNPAALMDVNYNILIGNRSFDAALEIFIEDNLLDHQPRNFLRLLLDDQGLRNTVVNAEDVLGRMIDRLRRRVIACPSDDDAQQLLEEAASLMAPDSHGRPLPIHGSPELLVPIHLKKGDLEFRCFSFVTTLATVNDVTLQELQIESYFPADRQSERFISSLGARSENLNKEPGTRRFLGTFGPKKSGTSEPLGG